VLLQHLRRTPPATKQELTYPAPTIYMNQLDIEPLITNITYKPIYAGLAFALAYPAFLYSPWMAVVPLFLSAGHVLTY
jgi:hypothetical protein